MKEIRAIAFTYEDFRDMAKKFHESSQDYSSHENGHAEAPVEIVYFVDSFKMKRMDFLDLVKEIRPELNLSKNAYYLKPLVSDGTFVVIIDGGE